MSAGDAPDVDKTKPVGQAGTLAGYHGVRERFWRHSKRYQVEIRDHVCKTKVHITIDREEKTDDEQAREAALLRDAVARINYEETGKKKALNFPDEEPPKEIMHRARVELDKARAKAAEARTKPKAPTSVKTPAAMPFGPHAAAALATLTQPPQEAHVPAEQDQSRKSTPADTSGEPERQESGESVSLWGCKRQRTSSARKRAGTPWHDAVASLHATRPRSGANPAADFPPTNPPTNPDAKLQAFLSGAGLQLPGQPAAAPSQPQMGPFTWQLQYAQHMQAAQMAAAAQAAQFQGLYAGLFQGATGQAQSIPGQTLPTQAPWGTGAVQWGAPAGLPWAQAPALVAAAAQAAAAANPSATASLAQQAAAWAAAQVGASLPGAAGVPVTSVPGATPASLMNPMQSMTQTSQPPCSDANAVPAAQPAAAGPSGLLQRPAVAAAPDLQSAAQPPSLQPPGHEPAAAAASDMRPTSCTAHPPSPRATLLDIADAAAAAAAELRRSRSNGDAAPAGAPQAPQASAGVAAVATQPLPAERAATSTGAAEAAPAASAPAAADSPSVAPSQPASTAASVDAAVVTAAPVTAAEAPVHQSENQRSGEGANAHSEVAQPDHKRPRTHRTPGSCTEEDSSDEATIAIKHTGSNIHSILPGMGERHVTQVGGPEEEWRPKKVMAHQAEPGTAV